MTRRNRWLKKQARKAQGIRGYIPKRIRAARKAYALKFAKYIYEQPKSVIPFPELLEEWAGKNPTSDSIIAFRLAMGAQEKSLPVSE